jgi:hypothetical protein
MCSVRFALYCNLPGPGAWRIDLPAPVTSEYTIRIVVGSTFRASPGKLPRIAIRVVGSILALGG